MAISNESKTATASFTNQAANSASLYGYPKSGQALNYDSNVPYDAATHPVTGAPITYDGVGTAPSYTNQAKS